MPRTLLLALVAVAALALGALPALAATPAAAASVSHASAPTTADDGDDLGDDWSEDPGDDWSEDPADDIGEDPGDDVDDDACVEEWDDAAGEWVAAEGDCGDDADLCWEDDCDEAADDAPPLVSTLHATPGRHGGRLRVQISFRLDRAGDVALTLERVGARSSSRCAAQAHASGGKGKANAKSCSRTVALSGTMIVAGHVGANATTLRRWKGRRLAPGSYRLTATPDAAGASGATTTFKIAPPRPRRR